MPDIVLIIIQDAFWASIAAVGFAMLFRVPNKALAPAASCGALGHALRTLLMEYGMQITPATLIGATLVGFIGMFYARQLRLPSIVFTVSGAIPMVPGVFAFRTMLYILRVTTAPDDAKIQEALLQASQNGIITGLVLAALAVGIASPSLLFDRHRPVV